MSLHRSPIKWSCLVVRAEFQPLEPRRMLCATIDPDDQLIADIFPPPPLAALQASANPGGTKFPLSDVPRLSSRPGAPASLYLDFIGDNTPDWGGYHPGVTPAIDQDGDPTTFTQAELDTIRGAWQAVSEDYSPFNINVTTVDPGNIDDLTTMKAVIGGSGAWYGQPAGGVSFVGSFYNALPNVAYIFLNSDANFVGAAISHEAGHGFGLQHQSAYDANGNKTDEYSHGDGITAPIMGYGYAARQTWWYGADTISSTTVQDDVSVIASSANGFGYRADDFPNAAKSAKPLSIVAGSSGQSTFTSSGVIEQNTDADWFSFNIANSGNVTAAVNVAPFADLDARLELRDSAGNLVAYADTTSLGESLTASVSAGTYRLGVMSHHYDDGSGGFFTRVGDIGQYSVTVTPPAPPAQTPFYGTPFNVSTSSATTIQMEDFDKGGEGIAYHDSTASNIGGYYRVLEGVDIKPASDGTTGFRLSDVTAGEWTEYTINVAQTGTYTLDFRVVSPASGAKFHAEVDGTNVTGSIALPNTGSWTHYGEVAKTGVNLTAGVHVLRVSFDAVAPTNFSGGGFDWLRISKTTASSQLTLTNSVSSFVRGGSFATSNYGSLGNLELKKWSTPDFSRESYLQFDLSSISSITNATLRLFGRIEDSTTSNIGIGVYGLNDPAAGWSESSLNWNNRPTSSSTAIATTTIVDGTGRWYTLNLTNYLKAQLAAGRKTVTLVLKMTGTNAKRVLINSDDAASNRPQLQIAT
jgi:hypothetical protein